MVADHRICISVLEGAFVSLHEVGTPLYLSVYICRIKEHDLRVLGGQINKVRFLSPLFWPVQEAVVVKSPISHRSCICV